MWTLILLGTVLCANAHISFGAVSKDLNPISMNTQREIESMQEMTRQSSYAYEQANFLSNIGPRLSGSSQAATAVAYVAQQMRELGLDVRLEPVTLRHWVRGREEAELVLIGERPKGPARRFWSQLSEIPSPRPIKDFDCS